MVREANVKQANAEKQLKEALGKVKTMTTHKYSFSNLSLFNYLHLLGLVIKLQES